MKKFPFSEARFLTSALDQLPDLDLPEIVLAGKSNVGKSSLINHLFRRKSLAKTSATPGKTRTLNFFIVDEKLAMVDLPGYGFAKRSKEEQKQWAENLEHYFQTRKTLALILLLIDSRREPSEEDLALIKWAKHFQKPLLIIFTKSDTLKHRNNLQKDEMHYSIKDPHSRKRLIDKINEFLCH